MTLLALAHLYRVALVKLHLSREVAGASTREVAEEVERNSSKERRVLVGDRVVAEDSMSSARKRKETAVTRY
jgi:hypothetical protein